MKKKILLVGGNGLLGTHVEKLARNVIAVFKKPSVIDTFSFETVKADRWPSDAFYKQIEDFDGDAVVNCAVVKKNSCNFRSVNTELPKYLYEVCSQKGIFFIHVGTDGEFSGNIGLDNAYNAFSYADASDPYGLSKANATRFLSDKDGCVVFRTSFVGLGNSTTEGILNEILMHTIGISRRPLLGIKDKIWSGITALTLANEILEAVSLGQRYFEKVTDVRGNCGSIVQLASRPVTKFDLYNIALEEMVRDKKTRSFFPVLESFSGLKNLSIHSAFFLPDIRKQLRISFDYYTSLPDAPDYILELKKWNS